MSSGARLAALALVLAAAAPTGAADELKTIPTRPGVTESFLLVRPAADPVAGVILFAGGNGALGLGAGGIRLGGNFLVRTRDRFAQQGLLVAVLDAPSDHASGLVRFRATVEHATDVRAVIAALRAIAPVPVWVVGTSMGTVSAANAAARLKDGGPDGLVLTSTVTRGSREMVESVGDVRLKDITVPTLLVHHRDDTCQASRYADAPGLVREFPRAPRRELVTFEGGAPAESGPCEARSPHGYLGLEPDVVKAIVDWIKATPRP